MTSTSQDFGGNRVQQVPRTATGLYALADGAYVYRLVRLGPGDTHDTADLGSCTVFCREAAPGATVVLEGAAGGDTALGAGDSVQLERCPVRLRAAGGIVTLLVAGVAESGAAPGLTVTRAGAHYKVTKPWGHELWLNGEHPAYCLKEVFILAGTRTSLQYHRFKCETNVLFEGAARLVYKRAADVANDAVGADDLGAVELAPISVVDVTPGILHRLEAVADTLLYETSTPHLDDVIRVQDDKARGHGRIGDEHATGGQP